MTTERTSAAVDDFASFFDATVERAYRLAMLATCDRTAATEATRRAYSDFWITMREPCTTRPELRLLSLVHDHARQ